ncbi:hypothetical protein AB0I10_27680 [Streptomyces sp. NPDC050636]|uniref:hypothetical protein n=1 Tax=Streptomyces sp. NPDC050636 TaxID=3154510 RepID=UPI00343DB8F3
MTSTETPRLSLIDLYLLADPILDAVGEGWSKDDDTPGDEQTIRFAHTDGRTFGLRRLWDGMAAQTFAHDPAQPGPRYNAAAHFTDSEAPLDTLISTLHLRLFPGLADPRRHSSERGTLRANGTRIPAPEPQPERNEQPVPRPAEPTAAPAPDTATAPAPAPAAKTKPARKRTARKTTPPAARRKTAPAKRKPKKVAAASA